MVINGVLITFKNENQMWETETVHINYWFVDILKPNPRTNPTRARPAGEDNVKFHIT